MNSLKHPFYLKLASVSIILIAGWYISIGLQQIIVPLLFSFLFAILLLPPANYFEVKWNMPRSAASMLAVLLFLFVLSAIVYLMAVQIGTLATEWPSLRLQLNGLFADLQEWMAKTFHINIKRQTAFIETATTNLFKSSAAILEKTVLSVSSIVLFLVFILIYTVLLLFYRRLLMRFVVSSFSEKYISVIYDIMSNIKRIIKKYITGLFFEMVIVAVIACVVFWLLGIRYVFLLGLIVGVFNVIPYIGIATALLISVCITFATSDAKHTLFVAIAIICIHLFDSNFLMPKIVGAQVKINPLLVILGVILGEMVWGISGMFLSIPYLAVAKVIFDRVEGMQSWGILLGEEEETPPKVKRIIGKLKRKEAGGVV